MSATGHERRRREARRASYASVEEADRTVQQMASRPVSFDLSGNWMQARARVRDTLGTARVPTGKAEAAQWLRDAGYEVEGE